MTDTKITDKAAQIQLVLTQLKQDPTLKINELKTLRGTTISHKASRSTFPICVRARIKTNPTENIQEIQAKYSQLIQPYGDADFDFESLTVGDHYIPFPVTSLASEEVIQHTHTPGEIWLIDFWATWCAPCQPVMAHNQEMLEEHPEWKGKVRIFGISIDQSKAKVVERVTSKKWNLIEHYFSADEWEGKGLQLYNVKAIPFVVLVDMNGIIVKIGNPSKCDVENSINTLFQGGTIAKVIEEKPTTEVQALVSMEEAEKLVSAVIEKYKSKIMELGLNFRVVECCNHISLITTLKVTIYSIISFNKKEENEIKEFANMISSELKPIEVALSFRYVEMALLLLGKKCSLCNCGLGIDVPQYKCRECELVLCSKCGESSKHEHILLYIKKNADLYVRHGTGVTKPGDDNKVHAGIACDCCGNEVSGIRWKCAKCADTDMCEKCFNLTLNGKDLSNAPLYEQACGVCHDIDRHIYLRIARNDSFA